jgi:hypothetical protein
MSKQIQTRISKSKSSFPNLSQPSKEVIRESKILVKHLKDELSREKIEKVQKNIVLCHLG